MNNQVKRSKEMVAKITLLKVLIINYCSFKGLKNDGIVNRNQRVIKLNLSIYSL